jgi:hypothetical protein
MITLLFSNFIEPWQLCSDVPTGFLKWPLRWRVSTIVECLKSPAQREVLELLQNAKKINFFILRFSVPVSPIALPRASKA